MKRTIITSAALFLPATVTPGSALPHDNQIMEAKNNNHSSNLRGSRRQLNTYINPLQWLNEDGSDPSNAMSCVIRQANVPNGQGLILTADGGSDVSLEPRRNDLFRQRWFIYDQQ